MRALWLLILSVSIAGAMVWTLMRLDATTVRVKSIPKEHIQLISEGEREFTADFLITSDTTFHTEFSAVQRARIVDETSEETLGVSVTGMDIIERVQVGHRLMHRVRVHYAHAFVTDGFSFISDDASLAITYRNDATMRVPLGHFHCYHKTPSSGPVSVVSIHNVHGRFTGGVTSKGMRVELHNDGEHPIEIDAFNILGGNVGVNERLIQTFARPYEPFMPIEAMVHGYTPELIDEPMPVLRIQPGEKQAYVIPFAYGERGTLLHRYPLIIDYTAGDASHTFVMEDFVFINTDLFVKDNLDLLKWGAVR